MRELCVLVAYSGLCIAMLWPLPRNMSDHVIGAKYYWDAYTNAMALGARVQNVLGEGPGGHYDSYFFAPIPDSIAFNENLFGLSLLYAPFHLASDNPLFAYNAVLLLSLVLSSYFTYRLVLRLSGSPLAAFLAGAAFPYCPYAFFEMGRIQLVATQWIPLTFLFLHRALEQQRLRDVAGLAFAYAMQIGTCLYYAMFLLPLLALIGGYLFAKHRPSAKALLPKIAGVGAVLVVVVGLMIAPYFASRRNFDLTRSEDFAENFDGELWFFNNVDMTNRAWPSLRHEPVNNIGAHEEVAFPGVVIAALALFSLLGHAALRLSRLPPQDRVRSTAKLLGFFVASCAAAAAATFGTHSLLSGTIVLGLAALTWLLRVPHARLAPPLVSAYAFMLALAVLLFLGLTLTDFDGRPVRGLYYYLYTYVPGWNGIRKISRQAIMTSFGIIVLAAFGAQLLLAAIKPAAVRVGVALVLVLATAYEYREAPVPLIAVPAGEKVAPAYQFIARHPGSAPIALLPAGDGRRVFRGHRGMAFYNYLALYHHRRTLNGKSSFIPPVTRSFNNAMSYMPSEYSTRVLRELGAEYVVLHTWDMSPDRSRRVVNGLRALTTDYKLVFQDGADYVFQVLPSHDELDRLENTPARPADVVLVPRGELRASANVQADHAARGLDGDPESKWSTGRNQFSNDYYEITLAKPRTLAALELASYRTVDDAPLSYRVEATDAHGVTRVVARRDKLRLFREQVFSPKSFVLRVLLDGAVDTTKLRITIVEPTPGRHFAVHEASLFARN